MRDHAPGLLRLAAAVTCLLAVPPQGAWSEASYASDDVVYATGAVFESEEELTGKPRLPLFLPPAAALRDWFPSPGEQGSCVGWAVGYDTFRTRVNYWFVMRIVADDPPPVPPPPAPAAPAVTELRLPATGCRRLAIEERAGRPVVAGFVSGSDDRARFGAAAAPAGARVEVAARPWPQCEALKTMERPLGAADRPSIALPKASYRPAETLAFDVRTAGFPGYLHVAYLQADGSVVHLVQSDPLALVTLPPGAGLRFGNGQEGRRRFTVSAPFGNEMIVVLASRSPLFDADRHSRREIGVPARRSGSAHALIRPAASGPEVAVLAVLAQDGCNGWRPADQVSDTAVPQWWWVMTRTEPAIPRRTVVHSVHCDIERMTGGQPHAA